MGEHDILFAMRQIITSALYLITIFSVSKFIFIPANLYYELLWLDIPMHIMGGFGVASLVSALFSYKERKVSFFHLFIAYTVIAVIWEAYEYQNGVVTYQYMSDWFDTATDYVNGLLGAAVAYLLIRK